MVGMDRYQSFARSGLGRFVVSKLGLPDPYPLRRHSPGTPPLDGPVLIGGGGRLADPLRAAVTSTGLPLAIGAADGERYGALVFDASGIDSVERLRELHAFFQPVIRSLGPCGRVVVFGTREGDGMWLDPAERVSLF